MKVLKLLFTKSGLQYQITKNRSVLEEDFFFENEENVGVRIVSKLEEVLCKNVGEIWVYSSINHYNLMPFGFDKHEMGQDLIAYNADFDVEQEEVMLSVNGKHHVQFYYSFPLEYYTLIKGKGLACRFNFSGEKFLQGLSVKNRHEIHINLYHHQCEFFAFCDKKMVLYNNLDVNSEVDFLYFVMFTVSKLNFDLSDTYFYIYGETSENDTFISELGKFVNHMKVVFDNAPKRNFILNL